MKNDYILTDEYNDEIFKKVYILKKLPTIDKFMETEYKMTWLNYKKTRKDDEYE